MPILKPLIFIAIPARSHDAVAARRAKLLGRLEEDKKLHASPGYVRTVQRWTGKDDERRQVEKRRRGCRRTLITRLAKRDVNLKTIAEIAGPLASEPQRAMSSATRGGSRATNRT